jgi:hypothetical protein
VTEKAARFQASNTAIAASFNPQSPNPKQIEMTKCQTANQDAAGFRHWNFGFGNYLGCGAWDLRFLARRTQE